MPSDIADAPPATRTPFLITFSGIDGAGKTTQIEYLFSSLQERGLRVLRLTFWDHIAVWPRMRAGVGQRAADFYHADQSQEKSFSPKNHKHIRKWYLTLARSGLYLLDVVRLRCILSSRSVREYDVVIFDRYIYDQIANLYSRSLAARIYRRLLLWQAPSPDLAFILDTSPATAFARKPEYPLEFMHQNRQNFLGLREFVPQLITIPDAAAEHIRSTINLYVGRSRISPNSTRAAATEDAAESAVVRPQKSRRVRNEPTPIL